MKKPDGKFKIKRVLKDSSRIVYLVYRDTMVPQQYCWCYSKTCSNVIALTMNQFLFPTSSAISNYDEFFKYCDEEDIFQ